MIEIMNNTVRMYESKIKNESISPTVIKDSIRRMFGLSIEQVMEMAIAYGRNSHNPKGINHLIDLPTITRHNKVIRCRSACCLIALYNLGKVEQDYPYWVLKL